MFTARARRIVLWIGVLGPFYYMALLAVLGTFAIGYDPVQDSMSELGAVDSQVREQANILGFIGLGVVLLAFAAAVGSAFGPSLFKFGVIVLVLLAAGLVIALSFLPCDPGCIDAVGVGSTHALMAGASIIALPAAMIVSTRLLYRDPRFGRVWGLAALWGGLLAMVIGSLLFVEALEPITGLVQRLSVTISLAWVVAVSARLLRTARRTGA